MNSLEYFLIALVLAFVTQWALQQYHKHKHATEKPFSLMELGILMVVYLIIVFMVDAHTGAGAGGGTGVAIPPPSYASLHPAPQSGPVISQPETYLRRIHEQVMTGLPPF